MSVQKIDLPPVRSQPRTRIEPLRMPRNLAVGVGVALGIGFALVSAWLTPRGPITAGQVLVTMGAALAVGLGSGYAMGTRWSMLVTPAAFIVAYEIARIGAVGPTVDFIDFGSMYGILAFGLGRLLHGVFAVVPMMLGAVYGTWLAGRTGRIRPSRIGFVTTVVTLGLVALAFVVWRPATTAPILDAGGTPAAGGIAELTTVRLGGHEQGLMIRGRSVDNPVLLYLTGGPGGSDMGAMRLDTALESDFVVVTWDQRGAGKSYAALDPVDTFTPDRLVADTIELTEYLLDRFDEERVFLVGQSWGSALGAMAADARPDLYHALVGVGQMVDIRATDVMFWEDTLAWARATANPGLAAELEANGPPPYSNLNDYAPVVSYEHSWNAYPGLDLNNEMPAILMVPELSLMDKVNAFRGFLDTNATLYPQLQDLDFRSDLVRLAVPYYMVLGEHEARGRAVLAEEWFEMLDAPGKYRVVFEGAGHRANFDRPAEFAELMARVLSVELTN